MKSSFQNTSLQVILYKINVLFWYEGIWRLCGVLGCCNKGLILFLNGIEDMTIRWRKSLRVTIFTFLFSSEHVGKCDVRGFFSQS